MTTPVLTGGAVFLDRRIADLEVSRDRRTVECLVVPWMRPTPVVDVVDGRPVAYSEQFARGALSRAEAAPNRVRLCWGHSEDFANALGRGVSFRQSDEGEIGVFALNAFDADRAMAVLDGMGVSARFQTIAPRFGAEERDGALVTRSAVHLDHLAAVTNPAYEDARVLQLRSDAEALREEAEQQRAADDTLRAVLQRNAELGVTLTEQQRQWLDEHA